LGYGLGIAWDTQDVFVIIAETVLLIKKFVENYLAHPKRAEQQFECEPYLLFTS